MVRDALYPASKSGLIMAKFKVNAISEKMHGAKQYTSIRVSDQEISKSASVKICLAGAEVLMQSLRDHLEATTNDPNESVRGQLAKSIKAEIYESSGSVIVGPTGKHHGKGTGPKTREAGYHRPKTGQGKSHKRKHHGMSSAVSAQDVGYYLEYGTPRMKAEHWMEKTLIECDDKVLEAMEDAFNDYLNSIGL